MGDSLQDAINALREAGKEAEASAVESLRRTHNDTMRNFDAAVRSAHQAGAAAGAVQRQVLPPLPPCVEMGMVWDSVMRYHVVQGYTAEQMEEYARSAIAASGNPATARADELITHVRDKQLVRIGSGNRSTTMTAAEWFALQGSGEQDAKDAARWRH
jgi:hypothetical protein